MVLFKQLFPKSRVVVGGSDGEWRKGHSPCRTVPRTVPRLALPENPSHWFCHPHLTNGTAGPEEMK